MLLLYKVKVYFFIYFKISYKNIKGFNETDFIGLQESGEQIISIWINSTKKFNSADHLNTEM